MRQGRSTFGLSYRRGACSHQHSDAQGSTKVYPPDQQYSTKVWRLLCKAFSLCNHERNVPRLFPLCTTPRDCHIKLRKVKCTLMGSGSSASVVKSHESPEHAGVGIHDACDWAKVNFLARECCKFCPKSRLEVDGLRTGS